MKSRGFTLIELVVSIMILAIGSMLVIGVIASFTYGDMSSVSWGINGRTESRCIEGYKFIVDQGGHTRQILDEFGKGVRCQKDGM